jgi:hypothetical protein
VPTDATTLVAYILVLAGLAVLHAAWPTGSRRRTPRFPPVPEGPRCSQCGYILYNPGTRNCPECGQDLLLDVVPLDLPPPPRPPVAPILAIATVAFPLTLLAAYPFASRMPRMWQVRASASMSTDIGELRIGAFGSGSAPENDRWGHVVVSIQGSKRSFVVDRSFTTLTSIGRRFRGARPVALAPQPVAHLLAETSPDGPAEPTALAAANDLIRELESLRDGGWPPTRMTRYMNGSYLIDPDDNGGPFFWLPPYTGYCILPWFAVTTLAAVPLLRHHASRRAAHATALRATTSLR